MKYKIDKKPLSKATLKAIEEAREDIKNGRVYTLEEIKKKLKTD